VGRAHFHNDNLWKLKRANLKFPCARREFGSHAVVGEVRPAWTRPGFPTRGGGTPMPYGGKTAPSSSWGTTALGRVERGGLLWIVLLLLPSLFVGAAAAPSDIALRMFNGY
jgi:hypothetical protein